MVQNPQQDISESSTHSGPVSTAAPDNTVSTSAETVSKTEQKQQAASLSPQTPAGNTSSRIFDVLAAGGPILPILLLVAISLPGLRLWGMFPNEDMLLDAFSTPHRLFAFSSEGIPLPEISSICLWFLAGIRELWQTLNLSAATGVTLTLPILASIGNILAAALAIIVVWVSALVFTRKVRTALTATLLFLTTFSVYALLRMDLADTLFTAFAMGSLLLLYDGYSRPKAPVRLIAGYALAALAAVTGGAAGIFLPLISSFLFILWRGTFRRAGAVDGAIAFGVMLVLIFSWITLLALNTDGHIILDACAAYHIGLWIPIWNTSWTPEWILTSILVCSTPWLLLILFLPWEKIVYIPCALWKNRYEAPESGWIWCSIFGITVLMILSWGSAVTLLAPLVALLAIAASRTVLELSALRTKLLFSFLGGLLILSAVILGSAFLLPQFQKWLPETLLSDIPPQLHLILGYFGLLPLGGIFLLAGIILIWLAQRRGTAGSCLVVFSVFLTLLSVPLNLYVLPELFPISLSEQMVPDTELPNAPEETRYPDSSAATPETATKPNEPAELPAIPENNAPFEEPHAAPLMNQPDFSTDSNPQIPEPQPQIPDKIPAPSSEQAPQPVPAPAGSEGVTSL